MKIYHSLFLLVLLLIGGHTVAHAQVVVDAGHTAQVPGSLSATGRHEHVYTQLMQQKVLFYLKALKISANAGQSSKSLSLRASQPSTLFVSLHYDSIPLVLHQRGLGETIAGYSVFVSQKNPKYSQSLMCGRSIAWGLMHAGEKPALFHQKGLGGKEPRVLVDRSLGVHRFDDLLVLKLNKSPAVLVELGMWINSKEEPRLLNEQTMNKQARGIALGIKQCLE